MISKDLSCGSSNTSDTRDKSDRCRCRNWVHWWSVDRGTGSGVSQWVKVDGQCQTQDQGQPVGESGLAMSDSGSVSASGQKWTVSVPVPVSQCRTRSMSTGKSRHAGLTKGLTTVGTVSS